MAQRTITQLEDDIDGGAAKETLRFGLDGRAYEIDLNAKNAKKLRKALEPYEAAARRVAVTRRRTPRPSGRATSDAAAIRVWAASSGYSLGNRGRIPLDVQRAFESR